MMKNVFRIGTILAVALTASQTILSAGEARSVVGVWDVSVAVKDCHSGNLIRTVRSLQMFQRDGSFTETANTFLRGISLGNWDRTGREMVDASYWFFRYKPDGTFASFAKANNMITLDQDDDKFTASGTIQDFDANGALISTGCVTQTANRLTDSEHRK